MNCKICELEITNSFFNKTNELHHWCNNCNFIFRDDNFILTNELERNQYDFHNNSIKDDGYVNWLNNFKKEGVDPFIKKGVCLDFGSGPGPVLYELMKNDNFDAYHYDPYYNNINYNDKKYNLITSTEVFEHFNNPLKTFKEILSVCNKGTIISIMTQFHPNDKDKFNDWWYQRDATHISFYQSEVFEFLAKKYNLKIIYNNKKNILVYEVI